MGSERANNDSGKIIICRGRTHVAWQDVSCEDYSNRARTYDHATGVWGEPVTLDAGVDNHESPARTEAVSVGVGTNPMFLCGPDGTFYLTLRGQDKERNQREVVF